MTAHLARAAARGLAPAVVPAALATHAGEACTRVTCQRGHVTQRDTHLTRHTTRCPDSPRPSDSLGLVLLLMLLWWVLWLVLWVVWLALWAVSGWWWGRPASGWRTGNARTRCWASRTPGPPDPGT